MKLRAVRELQIARRSDCLEVIEAQHFQPQRRRRTECDRCNLELSTFYRHLSPGYIGTRGGEATLDRRFQTAIRLADSTSRGLSVHS